MLNDSEIIALFFQRIDRALTEMQQKYGKYLRTIAYNILQNHEDAEECENEVYMKLWNSIPPTNPTNLKAFAGKMIRNLSLDKKRAAESVKRGGNVEFVPWEDWIEYESIDDSVNEEKLTETLNSFLFGLSYEERYIFVKRFWEKESVEHIAENLGRKPKTISNRISMTKKKLAKYLAEKGVYHG